MALAYATSFLATALVVGPVAGRRIRLHAVHVVASAMIRSDLVTDQTGTPVAIGPALFSRSSGGSAVRVRFDREPLVGQVGKDVAVVTTGVGFHSLLVEYSVID